MGDFLFRIITIFLPLFGSCESDEVITAHGARLVSKVPQTSVQVFGGSGIADGAHHAGGEI
jgi:hypothetical protein